MGDVGLLGTVCEEGLRSSCMGIRGSPKRVEEANSSKDLAYFLGGGVISVITWIKSGDGG